MTSVGFQWSALATAIAAVVTLLVGVAALVQKQRADRRSEWWRRLQWAIEQTSQAGAPAREAGLLVLKHLVDSRLSTRPDTLLIRDVAANIVRRAREAQ